MSEKPNMKTKTSRILSVYHLFLNCQEVSCQELRQQFEVSEKTSFRDIRLLERAGILETRYDRDCRAFYLLSLEVWPMAGEKNQTRRKYLEKLRRLCVLMARMAEENRYNGTNKIALYQEVLPRFPQLKILLGKKERSVDFADEAVVDFYFLLTASVLALDSFVDGYFFN